MPDNRHASRNPTRPAAGGASYTAAAAGPIVNVAIDKTKMYGLLHDVGGQRVERHVRFMKVGFGLPVGKDIHVYLRKHAETPWVITVGRLTNGKREQVDHYYATREEAKAAYLNLRKAAPERKYPTKFPYFTFSRLSIDGTYWPDFEAIEQHGSKPNELDVVFIANEPFEHAFQAWTAANLKCEGDGKNARRRVDWAQSPKEIELANQAKAQGLDFFPILGRCYTGGCPFPRGDKPLCKPHGRLYFQLTNSPRIGGSCTYDTTGYRSIAQLDACLTQIKAMTGNGDPDRGAVAGIPLKLVLRPYKTSHNGQPSIQYAVSLEFRANNAIELARLLNRHAEDFHIARQSQLQISAPVTLDENPTETGEIDEAELVSEEPVIPSAAAAPFPTEAAEAAALMDEFYGDFPEQPGDFPPGEFPEDSLPEPPPPAAPAPPQPQQQELLPSDTTGPFTESQFAALEFEWLLDNAKRRKLASNRAQLHAFLGRWTKSKKELFDELNKP